MTPTIDMVVRIPDTLRSWPWQRRINPHYAVCKEESSTWCESFHAFDSKTQIAFNKCDFNLLGSLAYPLLDKEGCRVGCDLMNLFFVIDDHTDVVDDTTARIQGDIIMDALCHPHLQRPTDEWIGGEIARQFWSNAIPFATQTSQTRFVNSFQTYLDAVVQQAKDRNVGLIRDIDSYFEVRRETIGATSSFAVGELYLNIPQEIIDHPVIAKLTELTIIDMIILDNDICSYKVEFERGDGAHNIVTVVMHQLQMDVQGAMNWVSDLYDKLSEQFLQYWFRLPTFGGPIDSEVRTYCDMLGNWVRANNSWHFESERYFGTRGSEIQKTRIISLSRHP